MINVEKAGFYTTIQDTGRRGFRHLGIPVSGPMDRSAFRLANALLPNKNDDTVLECTFVGPQLKIGVELAFVVTGATVELWLDQEPIVLHKVYKAKAGSILKMGKVLKGIRSYIRFSKALQLPSILGSRSFFYPLTSEKTLKTGDVLTFQGQENSVGKANAQLRANLNYLDESQLEVSPGLDWAMLPKRSQETVLTETHEVISHNRMGYRLSTSVRFQASSLLSQLVLPGMVQLTPGGELLIATADCQVTGGYLQALQLNPKALATLAQKAEGSRLTFENTHL